MKSNSSKPASRPAKHFNRPADGPHRSPPKATPPTPSNDVAREAVRRARNPGQINRKQQVY